MATTNHKKLSLNRRSVQLIIIGLALFILTPQIFRLLNGDYSFKNIDWSIFGIAVAVFAATYIFATFVYLCLVPKKISFFRTLIVQIASGFANKITPAGLGNLGLNTLYLWHIVRLSKANAATIASANNLLGFIGYNVLFWLLILVGWTNSESAPPLTGFVIGSLAVGMGVSIGYLVVRLMPSKKHKLKRALLSAWKALSGLLKRPHRLMMGLIASMGITVCSIGAFALACQAAGIDLELSIIIVAFTAGVAAIAISPTPNGLGATEIAMTFVLTNSGVAQEQALSAVLLFRIISFWIPILPGYIAFRYISVKNWV
jgi:uncharacterized membrane protein YbhN (UPF0104 family)